MVISLKLVLMMVGRPLVVDMATDMTART